MAWRFGLAAAMLIGASGLAAQAPQGTLPLARRALAATMMDGHVYVAGGWNAAATQYARVDELDIATRRWAPAPPLGIARSQHSLVAVDGALWAVGGWSAERGLIAEIERWAPGERAWRVVARLPTPRREPGVAVLEGRIVVAGGFSGSSDADLDGYSDAVDVYDPRSGSWSQGPALGVARRGLALVTLDGSLYALCGYNAWDGYLGTVERWSPGEDSWRTIATALTPRTWASAIADRGDLVVLGGFDAGGPRASVERLNVESGRVCAAIPLRQARAWFGAVALAPGRALTMGGERAGGFSAGVEINRLACTPN